MSEWIGERRAPRRRGSHLLIALLAGPAALLAGPDARAGAIHHHKFSTAVKAESATVSAEAVASSEAVMEKWEPYFENALEHHLMKVRGPNAVKLLSVMVQAEGGAPRNSFVQYLEWRRSLHAEVFDANHPGLGRLLTNSQLITASTTPITTIIPPPPILGQGFNPPPPTITPTSPISPPVLGQTPQVPEPSMLLTSTFLLASAVVRRRWLASRS